MLEPYSIDIHTPSTEVLGDHQEPDNFGTVNTGTSGSESLGNQGY